MLIVIHSIKSFSWNDGCSCSRPIVNKSFPLRQEQEFSGDGKLAKNPRGKPLARSLLGLAAFGRASMPGNATTPTGVANGRDLAAQGDVANH